MAESKDFLTPEYADFSENADFIWNSIILSSNKRNVDHKDFMTALEYCIAYLRDRKMEEIKCICCQEGMAEKVSMIIDLRDYVFDSLEDEWNSIFSN